MMLFFLFYFLIIGVSFYFIAAYGKKKDPYWHIKNDFFLSKKRIPRETVELYADKMYKLLRAFAIFHVVFAIAQYFIGSAKLSLTMTFIPWIIFITYAYYYRKILTGKFNVLAVVLLTLPMILFPLIFIVPSHNETTVVIDDEKIRLIGSYGVTIPLEQLNQVFLADTLPNIGLRRGGINTGTIRKGNFESRSLRQNVWLLLNSNNKPFIYIIHGDNNRYLILNFRNSEKTREVYEQLRGLQQ